MAASPVAVGAGLFIPGFAVLGLGALLLLLPPGVSLDRGPRPRAHVVGGLTAASRRTVALALAGARAGGRTLGAVERSAAATGRYGAVLVGRASAGAALAVGRGTSAMRSRTAPAVWKVALRGRDAVVAWARRLSRATRSASAWAWGRVRPVARRGWAACLAGSAGAARRLASLARSVSEGLRARGDPPPGPRRPRPLPPGAPSARGSAAGTRRTRAQRPRPTGRSRGSRRPPSPS